MVFLSMVLFCDICGHSRVNSSSFRTVFQLRMVLTVESFESIQALVILVFAAPAGRWR